MNKKPTWADVDKRIRGRRPNWSKQELKEIEDALKKLPDLADQLDIVDVGQPAIGRRGPEADMARAN
jgi:hypothetical protein